MSRPAEALEKLDPYAPGAFLVLAAAAGGLRSPGGWLAFGALFLIWTVLSPRDRGLADFPSPVLFFFWLAAAAVFSPEPVVSIGAFSRYAVLGSLFFYAASPGGGARGWLSAVLGLGAAAALAFVFQRFSGHAPTGLIGANPNYSAAFCAAAFSPAVLALSGTAGKKEKFYYWALALLLAAGLYASGSRGAALAAFLSAAAGLGFARRWRYLAALFAAGLAAAAFLPEAALEGFLKLADPRAFERPRLWGAALEAALSKPLLGWGPGLFGSVFEVFKFPYFDGISFYGHSTLHAHSEIMNLAAEAGFPAAVFFLLTAAAALTSGGGAAIMREAGNGEKLPLKLCALSVLIQGSADMIFYSGAVAFLFWGSLGFSAAGTAPACRELSSERPGGAACRWKYALAALCFAGLALGQAAALFSGRQDFVLSSYDEAKPGKNPALALALARSAALDGPRDAFRAAEEGRAHAAAGNVSGAEAAFGRALGLEPGFAGARLGLALVYAASGRAGEACAELAALEKAGAASPLNPYQRGLVAYDRAAAEKAGNNLCKKKRTGAATASPRKTR